MLSPYILFPVALSGSLTLAPDEDAHVNESSTSTNYGSDTTAKTRYHGGGFGRQMYITFDLANTGNNNIDDATLRLYCSSGTAVDVAIFPASSNTWDESTLTYDNAPYWDADAIAVSRVSTTAGYVEWDVSQYCYENGPSVVSFVVRPTPESTTEITVNTKENGSNPPELVVNYGTGAAVPSGLDINPSIVGYGTKFQAGGWDVVKVTNTNTSGAGSFADAVSQSNRVVVFETSGTIDIDQLQVNASNLYIAGQTAPDQGIILKGQLAPVHGNNIIIQHLSVLNDYTTETDCVTIGNGDTSTKQSKVVFDHCWFAYGADECFDIWNKEGGDFHFRYCIFGPSVDSQAKGYGALFGGDATIGSNFRVSLDRCLFIHNEERNPLAKTEIVTLNNCLIYNRGVHGTYVSSREPTNQCNANIVGCMWIDGADIANTNEPIYLDSTTWVSGSQVWVDGCDWEGTHAPASIVDQWDDLVKENGVTGAEASAAIDWPTGLTTIDVAGLKADILSYCGPRPNNRFTELDAYMSELDNENGSMVTGGIPTIPTLTANTTTHTVPSNTTYEVSGYTSCEEWLHAQALAVEEASANPLADWSLQDLTRNDAFTIPSGSFTQTGTTAGGVLVGEGRNITFSTQQDIHVQVFAKTQAAGSFDLSIKIDGLVADTGANVGSSQNKLEMGIGFITELDGDTDLVFGVLRQNNSNHVLRKMRKIGSLSSAMVSNNTIFPSGAYANNYYLHVSRDGSDNIRAYYSTDGTTLTEMGSNDSPLSGAGYVIVFANDGDEGDSCRMTFSELSI